mmetsp:Transcript_8292/g.18929  ORF Transcript_8292/g.18929 Transcript_8292/m.18929 type:complete len:231 (+) Transcript_8292:559-1251(+)
MYVCRLSVIVSTPRKLPYEAMLSCASPGLRQARPSPPDGHGSRATPESLDCSRKRPSSSLLRTRPSGLRAPRPLLCGPAAARAGGACEGEGCSMAFAQAVPDPQQMQRLALAGAREGSLFRSQLLLWLPLQKMGPEPRTPWAHRLSLPPPVAHRLSPPPPVAVRQLLAAATNAAHLCSILPRSAQPSWPKPVSTRPQLHELVRPERKPKPQANPGLFCCLRHQSLRKLLN